MICLNISMLLLVLFVITKIIDSIFLMSDAFAAGILLFAALFFSIGLMSIGIHRLKRILEHRKDYSNKV